MARRQGILPHLRVAEGAAEGMMAEDWAAVSVECPSVARGLGHAVGVVEASGAAAAEAALTILMLI